MKKLFCLFLFSILLFGCQKGTPLNYSIWGSWDVTIDNRRYDMSVWMIKNNWFEGKTKNDIIEQLPERNYRPYEITDNQKTFCVKETDGWNIDFNPRPLAYLDIYFENDVAVKAVLRGREQSFSDKMNGVGKVSAKEYDTILIWNAKE